MITTEDARNLLDGGTVLDADGDKIGSVGQVFVDDQSGEPEWVTVKTGLLGGAESFIPLSGGTARGNELRVPYNKEKVKGAPRADDADGHLSEEQEQELYRYYEKDYAQPTAVAGAGHDTSGPDTDNAMTRSEEQLTVGTERVSGGKARLRKYVVTEQVEVTVPVSHEEVRLEREPITEANRGAAVSGGDLTSEEHEVELTEERLVVSKETVPVERVKMVTETVTEEQKVSESVRKEQIESDTSETAAKPGTDGR